MLSLLVQLALSIELRHGTGSTFWNNGVFTLAVEAGNKDYSNLPYKKNVESLAQISTTKKLQLHRPGLQQCPRAGVGLLCRCFSRTCNRIPRERWDSRAQGPVRQLGMEGEGERLSREAILPRKLRRKGGSMGVRIFTCLHPGSLAWGKAVGNVY